MSGLGYSIGRNKPYAGGFITEHYGNPASGLHTVQLELNRAIYMDERRRERGPRFAQVVADFASAGRCAGRRAARRSRAVPGRGGVKASSLVIRQGPDSKYRKQLRCTSGNASRRASRCAQKKKGPLE